MRLGAHPLFLREGAAKSAARGLLKAVMWRSQLRRRTSWVENCLSGLRTRRYFSELSSRIAHPMTDILRACSLGLSHMMRTCFLQGIYNLQSAPQARSTHQAESSSSEARGDLAGLQKGLRARFSRKRGGFYCIMHCEGQVLRTNVAPGHPYPVWRHEVSFKSVQISSDLKVHSCLVDYRLCRLS